MGEYMRATTVGILWLVTFASTVTALPPTTRPTTAETTKPSRTVVAVVKGKERELPDNQQEKTASLIVELLESCSVDRTGDSDAHGDRWKHYANATHLLVKFDPPQHVQFGSAGSERWTRMRFSCRFHRRRSLVKSLFAMVNIFIHSRNTTTSLRKRCSKS